MAVVSIRWSKNAASQLKYVQKERGAQDVSQASDCNLETAAQDFESVRKEHRNEDGNQALHIVQSFSAADSQSSIPEQLNSIGRKLADENFKGHQFVVRTHTDTENFHNHIVVNTVSAETGRKIENKKSLIPQLRASSDRLCLENGLSILNQETNERQAKLPIKVQKMVRAGKKSYLLDLVQKADVARSVATSHDEYRDILAGFGIRTVIEEKNISYFYPGKGKGKRGSKLGRDYDKPGLQEAYKANHEKYAKNPELRATYRNQLQHIQKNGLPTLPPELSKFAQPWSGKDASKKDFSQYTKVSRRDSELIHSSDRVLAHASVPVSEIKRARQKSIFDYCKRNNIALTTNERGERVIKGREFVVVSEFEFRNRKNGTRGSLIDLVAAHKKISLLQAVAHINGNQRLALLEQHMGEIKRNYNSFYIPKQNRGDWRFETKQLAHLMASFGAHPDLAQKLREKQMAQVDAAGSIRLFPKASGSAALEFVETVAGAWTKKTHGKAKTPFYSEAGKSSKAFVFTEPSLLLRHLGLSLFGDKKRSTGILGLLTSDEQPVHHYLAENRHVTTLQFVSAHPAGMSRVELDLFNNLKAKYQKHGIGVEHVTHEKALQMTLEKEVPGHGLSL